MPQQANKFKIALLAAFGFFIVLGLVVFSTYRSQNASNTATPITIWGTVDQSAFDNFVSKYEQDTKANFKLTYVEKNIDEIDNDVVQAIATGKGPDALLIPQDLEGRYLDKVAFITSVPERTFLDTYVQEADLYLQPDGSQFGVPFFVDPLVMYWNRDIFSSAGIAQAPTLWSDFPLLAGKVFEADQSGNITQTIAALGTYANITNAKALVSALLLQAGTPIVSSDGTSTFSSALYSQSQTSSVVPAVAAMTFFTDYSNPQKTVYSWNASLPQSKQYFLSGNLATYFGFASEKSDIAAKNPNLNFDVAMMPQAAGTGAKATFGELYGFAILKSSPNVVAAFNLVSQLASAQGVSDFLQFADVAPARTDLIAAGTTDPAASVFYNSALIAKGFIDPDMQSTDTIFQTMVEDITSGRLSPDDSVKKASTALQILLQGQ